MGQNQQFNNNNMMQNQQFQNQNRFQQQYQPNNFHHQGRNDELQHDERTELPRTEIQGEQIQQDGQHCPKELRQQPGLLPGVLQAHGKPGHEIQASSQRKHQTSWI